MKLRFRYTNFLMLAGLVAFAGCSKQLDVYPTTQEVDGNIITDSKSAETALNGVYYRFAHAGVDYNSLPNVQWYYDNEEMPSQLSGLLDYGNGGPLLSLHDYNPKTDGISGKWSYGYALVNAANGFLKNIEPVSKIAAADKSRMIAEAKFLRAYGNSELLFYYGEYADTSSAYGNILHDEFVTPENVFLPRSTVGATYDAILADLDASIPGLPDKNTIIAYTNKWAASLLKARVLMNRGVAGDYNAVIALTKDIIANSPFQLEGNVKDLFLTKGLASSEVMLGIQPYSNVAASRWQSYIRYADYVPNDFMIGLFAGDPRADWYIQTVVTTYGPYTELTKYYPGSITDIAPTPITENSYAFRLTEAYLLEAEATVLGGGNLASAKGLLKTVLQHAGFTDLSFVDAATSAADLDLLIVKETMKNFASENGADWFALRRLPFATIQSMLPTIKDKSVLILPVPDAEIISNSAIKQNPKY